MYGILRVCVAIANGWHAHVVLVEWKTKRKDACVLAIALTATRTKGERQLRPIRVSEC
jgi:hypothetical protein